MEHKSWLSLGIPCQPTQDHKSQKNELKYALLIFGQIRCGISGNYFETNLLELRKVVNTSNVDVYILTDREPIFWNEIVKYFEDILIKYKYNLKMMTCTNDYIDLHEQDIQRQQAYDDKVLEDGGRTVNEVVGYNNFVARLYYRRYYLHQLFKNNKTMNYDYVIWGRFFDMDYRILKDFDFLKKNDTQMYFAGDSFFIGSEENMDKLAKFAENMAANFTCKSIWMDENFCTYFKSIDCCLAYVKSTYCSEVQTINYIMRTFPQFKSLRYDYNDWFPELGKDYMWAKIKRA